MESALAAANYLIKKSEQQNQEINVLKVMRLVYLAHGWSLAIEGHKSFIDEPIVAKKYGPYIMSIFNKFKKYENGHIYKTATNFFGQPINLKETDSYELLDEIWDRYGQWSSLELSTSCHQKNSPWDIIYNQIFDKSKENIVIPDIIIQNHYVAIIHNNNRDNSHIKFNVNEMMLTKWKHIFNNKNQF